MPKPDRDVCPDLKIKQARKIADELKVDSIIILAFPDLNISEFKGVSYGQTKEQCKMTGRIMDKCMEFLANPENWEKGHIPDTTGIEPDFIIHGLMIDPISLKAIDWMQPEPYQILCKDENEKKEYLLKIINAGFIVAGKGEPIDG